MDPAAYRDAGELERALRRDPIALATQRLLGLGAPPASIDALRSAAQAEIADALRQARAAPLPAAAEAFTDVQDAGAGRWI